MLQRVGAEQVVARVVALFGDGLAEVVAEVTVVVQQRRGDQVVVVGARAGMPLRQRRALQRVLEFGHGLAVAAVATQAIQIEHGVDVTRRGHARFVSSG